MLCATFVPCFDVSWPSICFAVTVLFFTSMTLKISVSIMVLYLQLFEVLLMLRADTNNRLGLCKDGAVSYSSFFICNSQ